MANKGRGTDWLCAVLVRRAVIDLPLWLLHLFYICSKMIRMFVDQLVLADGIPEVAGF